MAVREPGGTALGEKIIRPVLRDPDYKEMDPITNVLLYTASRSELHFKREIPFLDQNPSGILLKDRSWLSTIALQSVDGASIDYIEAINRPFMNVPGKFVIIDIPVEETIVRMKAANRRSGLREPDWRDSQKADLLNQIRHNYLDYAKKNKDRCVIFDCFDDPWVKAAKIKLDVVINFGQKEGKFYGTEEILRLENEFARQAHTIVETNESRVFTPEPKYVKTFDIDQYRQDVEEARIELNMPSKEKLREQMHSDWQMLGLENVNHGLERGH